MVSSAVSSKEPRQEAARRESGAPVEHGTGAGTQVFHRGRGCGQRGQGRHVPQL